MSSLRLICLFVLSGLLLSGCSTQSPRVFYPAVPGMSGAVHGGQQPVVGATIQLYGVGTGGDGTAATPLLTSVVKTDASGNFDISGLYTCPSPSPLVYITATGGSPAPGTTNNQIAAMDALASCTSIALTFINMNEITTVAAVYALAPFMSSYSSVASSSSDAPALAAAFTTAGYFANTTTGATPGSNVPAGASVPTVQVNTLADLMAVCINSPGGVAGDGTACGTLFALTQPPQGVVPTDTIGAFLNLANYPALNTALLYNLIPPASPFQPFQSTIPPDLSLHLAYMSSFTASPASVAFPAATVNFSQATQTVTINNAGSSAVSIYSTAISGQNASDFSLVAQPATDCTYTVAANSSCSYQVSFIPLATGLRSAYLLIGNTSPTPTVSVALSGVGTAGAGGTTTLSPSSLTFTQLGTPQTLTLTNSGSSALSINGVRLSSSMYTQTNTCGSSLPASSSCSIYVSVPGPYAPPAATVTVVDDAAAGPQSASLAFSGTPGATFSPVVDFSHWSVGAAGTQPIYIFGPGRTGSFTMTISGTNATDFSFSSSASVLSSTCSYNYGSGIQCNPYLTFKPSALGTRTATVNIAGVGNFTLTGVGDAPGLDFGFFTHTPGPTAGLYYATPLTTIDFGNNVLTYQGSYGFVLQNTGTAQPLAIQNPVITGPNAADFSATGITGPNDCSYQCNPTVNFYPLATGPRTATITYTDTTGTVVRSMQLHGVGFMYSQYPTITAATNLQFTNTPVGTVSAPRSVVVQADQNHPIQASLTPVNPGGSVPFVFTGSSFCASTPCTLNVAYAPTSASGAGPTQVQIGVVDPVNTFSATTTASGQVAPLTTYSVTPSSITFPTTKYGTTSAPQTLTIFNNGDTTVSLTFSSIGPAFALTSHCPASLVVNASCTVDVTLTPDPTYPNPSIELYVYPTGAYIPLQGSGSY